MRTATYCNTLQPIVQHTCLLSISCALSSIVVMQSAHCTLLQHAATLTATHKRVRACQACWLCCGDADRALHLTAAHCNTLQHTYLFLISLVLFFVVGMHVAHNNLLQHAATCCNICCNTRCNTCCNTHACCPYPTCCPSLW